MVTLVLGQLQAQADVSFVAGFGSSVSLGGQVQGDVAKEVWASPAAAGSMKLGLLAAYQVAPYGFYASYFPGNTLTGAEHRLRVMLVLGHDVKLLESRRLLVGVELFLGWAQLWTRGSLTNSDVGVSGSSSGSAGALVAGVGLKLGVRVSERVWITARGTAPFPTATAIMPYVMASLGVALEL